MKSGLKTIMIASVLFLALSSLVKADKWHTLRNKEFGYRIEFPVKPTISEEAVPSEIGLLKMNMATYDATAAPRDENVVYMVNYTEYPEEFMSTIAPSEQANFYRSAIDGAVGNVNGKLLTEGVIELDGHQGREITVDYQDGLATMRMQMYLVGHRFYLLQTMAYPEKDGNLTSKRFMDSFTILK